MLWLFAIGLIVSGGGLVWASFYLSGKRGERIAQVAIECLKDGEPYDMVERLMGPSSEPHAQRMSAMGAAGALAVLFGLVLLIIAIVTAVSS